MMTKRGYQLIRELLLARKPVTLEVLARRLGVSPRTVRTELDALESWFSEGSRLIRKQGVGITISLNEQDHRKVLQEVMPESLFQPFSPADRQRFIFLKLLQNDPNFRTMQQFADALYISRIAISKDLEDVEKMLDGYGLQLLRKPHYGLEVAGSEENLRKAVADYLVRLTDKNVLLDILDQDVENSMLDHSRIDQVSYKQIRSLFPENEIKVVRQILEQTEQERGVYFTDDNFVTLLIHLVISLERIKQNKALSMTNSQLDYLRQQEVFAVSSQIARKLEDALDIKVPEAEIGYMALHILGAKVEHSSLDVALNLRDFDPELVRLAQGMIEAAEGALHISLIEDKQLLFGLLLHLRPVINRLKYGLCLRNPILIQIKEQYPIVFGAAWIAGAYLEKKLGTKVSEEEIGFLAMHLGASVERAKHPKRVLVVCSSGVGTAQLLASRLRKLSPAVEVVDMVSALRLKERCRKLSGTIDAIVTTVPLTEEFGYPLVRVSPLLTDQDQQRLIEFLHLPKPDNPHREPTGTAFLNERPELEWFKEELMLNSIDCTSRDEVLALLGDLLEEKGYARVGFTESALHREQLSSTAVGSEIAIPHGNASFVSKSAITVATLRETVNWEDEPVNLVFMLALKPDDACYASSFFRRFYEAMDNPKWGRALKNCRSSKEMAEYIRRTF